MSFRLKKVSGERSTKPSTLRNNSLNASMTTYLRLLAASSVACKSCKLITLKILCYNKSQLRGSSAKLTAKSKLNKKTDKTNCKKEESCDRARLK